jgi:putative inorganic carbon (hco3(-)) transporter
VLLWLIPFNVIQLTASLPFDLKLDRLVLPFLFAVWIMSLATGGPAAPRLRMTLIHVGIAGFVATICLGLVLDAHYLNQTLEFEMPVKKITLLISYALFFLIVASSVRRTEVPAFMKYTLVLAVLCALGTIWEYRFHYNVFYDFSHRLLPGIFQVGTVDSNERDEIGRLMTRGPAEHPLETVGMLSMAFPIALVGIVHNKERRARILYGLAACILLAAAISTYRKSALLAPVSVALTIAYFRRQELLRLAPLGVVSMVVIHALSPGALGSILFQLNPGRLGVSTVSDRTADYDAIRPDVWTHLAFGRGYGSYDHVTYRVLDSEILSRLVDSGILGLLSLILMLLFIVAAARGLIRSRDPVWAPPALAVASAAIAFLVLAFLFDVSSFPHTPYILMSLAGLLAVMRSQPAEEPRPAPRHVETFLRTPAPASFGRHGPRHPELPARR